MAADQMVYLSEKQIKCVHDYIAEEQDVQFANEAQHLLACANSGDASAADELKARFSMPLRFGTAGFRAQVEAGTARINSVTIRKIAWAIGQYLDIGSKVVIGFDARAHSQHFAELCANVLSGMNFTVCIFEIPVATPIVSFALQRTGASAGLMITASHNPPKDNGVKVFGANGAQITRSAEMAIEALFNSAPSTLSMNMPDRAEQSRAGRREVLGDKLFDAYADYVQSTSWQKCTSGENFPSRSISCVYTPLHGVGAPFIERLAAEGGFSNFYSVPSQRNPDGRFPTVEYPNPEERDALNEAIKLADEISAELILANDPDADRLAVMLPSKERGTAKWRLLSGNDIGVLLGEQIALKAKDNSGDKTPLLMSTVVSSRLLSQIAAAHGASYDDATPGFSRIIARAQSRERQHGERLIFAYEESLGYCFGAPILDKDGLVALTRVLELSARVREEGKTLEDELDRLALQYGVFRSLQWSRRYEGHNAQAEMNDVMELWRNELYLMHRMGDLNVMSYKDWNAQISSDMDPANILEINIDDATRLVIRPSGTEPKMKFYLEKRGSAGDAISLATERARLDNELKELGQKLKQLP
jgi:phosphomannomutase